MDGQLGDVALSVADSTGGGCVEAGDAVEEGRLAGAVRADDPDDLPLVDAQVDVAQGLHAAEADVDVARLEERGSVIRLGHR